MRCVRRRPVAMILLAMLMLCPRAATAQESRAAANSKASFGERVRPLLREYCYGCHGPEKQKGERRFDTLTGEIHNDDAAVDYQDILDQLNLGNMPPQEAEQPSTDRRRHAIDWLTMSIDRFHQSRETSTGRAVLRRLNAREYRNSVRDLLHLDMTMFDPTLGFPRDQTVEHLDNVGETLVTSGHLLARYLAAADRVVEKAMWPSERPELQTWVFRDGFDQQPEIDKVHRRTNRFEHMTLYDVVGADKHEGAYGPIHAFREGVPFDGVYEIRIKAEALNRLHPYDPQFVGTDRTEPLRLGIVAGDHRAGPLHKPQPIEPLLAEIELADEVQWYSVRVRLDAGFTPRFTFRNGLMDARNMWGKLVKRYRDQFPKPTRGGIVENRFNAIKFGKLPQIHIHEIEIEGPFYDAWPTETHRALLGDDWERVCSSGELTDEQMRHHFERFASRAYRRPVRADELDRIMQVVATRRATGRSPLEAYADGLKTVLCSPGFLYFEESGDSPLSPYALAARLASFLWSSMPDQELKQLAADGKLNDPTVLKAQVARMLSDEKSDAFVEGFLDSWLTLRDLGSTPPDRARFPAFYHYDLDRAMREETRLFTRHLLDENLSIVNFLDSDFTFVNKPLARMYGLEPPSDYGFHRVRVDDPRRGGLLGQASILTVTANGIDTSPVVRGVWLLENILGTPPSPPPPDVEPLDPDIRGATTIRDQLKKHRTVASCNDCHRQIDPLGFALENFDPIGNWRDTYGRQQVPVDASGEMPNGQSFTDVEGLRQILVDRRDLFATALTRKLLSYAMGRPVEPADRPQVDQIVAELIDRGCGFQDLIQLVATSDAFRSK